MGIGSGILEGLLGSYVERKTKERDQQSKLDMVIAEARAKAQAEAEFRPKTDLSAMGELFKQYGLQPLGATVSATGEPTFRFGTPRPEPGAAKAAAVTKQAQAAQAQINQIFQRADQKLPAYKDDPNDIIPEGTGAIVGGIGRKLLSKVGLNEPARAFLETQVANARQAIRGLGEVGVLTDRDVADAVKLLPASTDSTTVRKDKLEQLNELIQAKINAYQSGASPKSPALDTTEVPQSDVEWIATLEAQGLTVTPAGP